MPGHVAHEQRQVCDPLVHLAEMFLDVRELPLHLCELFP